MTRPPSSSQYAQSGSVFTVLLGALAISGVLFAVLYQTMSGPVATMVRVTQKTKADTQMMAAAKIVVMDAMNLYGSNGDCDGDGLVEPRGWRVGTYGPTHGGLMPTSIGAPVTDPWGTDYGYCVWDLGTAIGNAGCDNDGSAGANARRLAGTPDPTTGSAVSQTVIAIISAGPNRQFETTCNAYVNGTTDEITTGGDDLVLRYSYGEASAASDSLWTLKAGTPSQATISKDIQVGSAAPSSATAATDTGIAAGSGIISADALVTAGKIVSGGAIQLATDAAVTTCDALNIGDLRYNATTGKPEICTCTGGSCPATGTYAWTAIGGGASSLGALNDAYTDYTTDHNMILGGDPATVKPAPIAGAQYNLFIGENAGFTAANSASGTSGNVAIGYAALAALTSGADNTAVGAGALSSTANGAGNTALGYNAGYAGTANVSGNYNTFIGYQAQANGAGYTNSTAIGNGATITASNQVVLGNASATEAVLPPPLITTSAITCSSTYTGLVAYDTSNKLLEFCNGTSWLDIGAVPAASGTANAFSFTALTSQSLNILVASNIVTVNGFTGTLVASVTGGGGSQISINGGAWTTSGNITPGATLQVRMTTSGSVSTELTAVVTVGSTSANWNVTTRSGTLLVFTYGINVPGTGFGGLAGADADCQYAANAYGLGGTYKAIMSDDTTSAASRLTLSYPIVNYDGTTVATSNLWGGSTAGCIEFYGWAQCGNGYGVWTGTKSDGSIYAGQTCSSWTSAGVYGVAGSPGNNWGTGWIAQWANSACSGNGEIYCLQQ